MSGEYVPSVDTLREAYASHMIAGHRGKTRAQLHSEFDRALARIASEAAERALREAADACGSGKTNWTKAWLRARADRLANEREGAGDV